MLLAVLLVAAGCAELTRWDPYPGVARHAGGPVPDVHVVQPGDTLVQIAFRYRLDWRQVAAWNRIGNADRIYPGQSIRLKPPAGGATVRARSADPAPGRRAATPPPRSAAGPPPDWRWPVAGDVVWQFGQSRRNPTGIGIGGRDGFEIRAAADGQVVYSGSGLIGYGQLIILKHNDSYLSAYGYNQALQVAEGDNVKSGQVIALMGRGPGDRPLLHFEIRRDGKPVDPAGYLPPR
ncbi:MAG: peptidoglycan DD-metalloendopeptidase family protein [Gammaproteobacteria bacterium]